MAGGRSRLRRAAEKIWIAACYSLPSAVELCFVSSNVILASKKPSAKPQGRSSSQTPYSQSPLKDPEKTVSQAECSPPKEACAICLEPMGEDPRPIFSAQCGHSFHFSCISSNVRFGGVTCPICRAAWTHLPACHDPGGPPRLLRPRPADIVLVASPTGPDPRPMARAMALVICSLRPADRLAIVSGSAAKALPLRRMCQPGKRAALRAMDRVLFLDSADPSDGLSKAVQILLDRTHLNPVTVVVHLTDGPTARRPAVDLPVPLRRFDVRRETPALEEFLWGAVGHRSDAISAVPGPIYGSFFADLFFAPYP